MWKFGEAFDGCQVPDVPAQQRAHVGAEPCVPALGRGPAPGLGETAADDGLAQCPTRNGLVEVGWEATREGRVDETLEGSLDLPLRERPQVQDLDATRERLGDLRDDQDPRRTGQQEPPRPAVSVDGRFQGKEQLGCPLHLVENHVPPETRQEAGRIPASRGHHGGIVEREVPPARAPLAQALRQRALARLSRTREEYGRGVIERCF